MARARFQDGWSLSINEILRARFPESLHSVQEQAAAALANLLSQQKTYYLRENSSFSFDLGSEQQCLHERHHVPGCVSFPHLRPLCQEVYLQSVAHQPQNSRGVSQAITPRSHSGRSRAHVPVKESIRQRLVAHEPVHPVHPAWHSEIASTCKEK